MEQVACRSCGCPISEYIQGWAGWAFGQPDLVGDVLAHDRKVRTR